MNAAQVRQKARDNSRAYNLGTIDMKQLLNVSDFSREQACYYVLLVASYLPDCEELDVRTEFRLRLNI